MEAPRSAALKHDLLAGISVSLVLGPQAMALATLAGLPPVHGLFAAAVAPIAAAPFASSRYLQTGPVAVTSLLTAGALAGLAEPGSARYVGMAALLAIVVGLLRLLIGLSRRGAIAFLMSRPVLDGFMLAAAAYIVAAQLPDALGLAEEPGGLVFVRAGRAFFHPGSWEPGALTLSLTTIALVLGGRRVHPLFPGVLVAMLGALLGGAAGLPLGPLLEGVPAGPPPLSRELPWESLHDLIVPGAVIAVVGFAESAAIARNLGAADRERWDPDREFVSQGVANVTAGIFSGFPVGGSFSRSALARIAGGRTQLTGSIAGAGVALLVLPFAGLFGWLPRAVLAATVLAAALPLLRPQPLLRIGRQSRPQALIAWSSFGVTLLAAPHVEYGVLFGVALSMGVHLWRELTLHVDARFDGGELTLRPSGVLWFGSAQRLEQVFVERLAEFRAAQRLVIDVSGLGRIDLSGALALADLLEDARAAGMGVALRDVPPHARRILGRVCAGVERIPGDRAGLGAPPPL